MVAKRIDANQREIVKGLRICGMSVLVLSSVGKGCPDILVGAFGKNVLMEIKDGKKPPSARKLTEHEEKFAECWKGNVSIVHSLGEALRAVYLAAEMI